MKVYYTGHKVDDTNNSEPMLEMRVDDGDKTMHVFIEPWVYLAMCTANDCNIIDTNMHRWHAILHGEIEI